MSRWPHVPKWAGFPSNETLGSLDVGFGLYDGDGDGDGNWTSVDVNWTSVGGNWTSVGGNWTSVGGNGTSFAESQVLVTAVTAVVLGIMILATIVGNVFVIAAILLERNLQSVANYLILSLAVADLLVAALVMPLGAVYEVSKEWTLGPELCDMWTASDVLCCTASILHLVAIALDRFWAVTTVDYTQHRSPRKVGASIAVIWAVSFVISAAPMMGWKDAEWQERLRRKTCLISQDVGYQVFASATTFYLPLAVILALYWRVYQAARKRIRRRTRRGGAGAGVKGLAAGGAALCRGAIAISETTTTLATAVVQKASSSSSSSSGDDCLDGPLRRREAESRRERKAAKTLGIITGAFVVCWLPFFVLAVLMPLCKLSCHFDPYLVAAFLWLGYFNSTLNPIIYTVFSPEFRNAFKRILCGRKRALGLWHDEGGAGAGGNYSSSFRFSSRFSRS